MKTNARKIFIALLLLVICSLSAFSMEVTVVEETEESYSIKILEIKNFSQAKFILTIEQSHFERTKVFNLINARIRKYQIDNNFNSYFRICNDVVQYNSKDKTVSYISDIQFRTSIYTKNEYKE
ncbi:MAG: hypothetical protein SPI86_10090 [Treponemataceae bacterium]|nr:hypothetical protein [Spirochaetales bacterium]MDY6032091.1 hypothetical protein [Treponemataceae bacterium]